MLAPYHYRTCVQGGHVCKRGVQWMWVLKSADGSAAIQVSSPIGCSWLCLAMLAPSGSSGNGLQCSQPLVDVLRHCCEGSWDALQLAASSLLRSAEPTFPAAVCEGILLPLILSPQHGHRSFGSALCKILQAFLDCGTEDVRRTLCVAIADWLLTTQGGPAMGAKETSVRSRICATLACLVQCHGVVEALPRELCSSMVMNLMMHCRDRAAEVRAPAIEGLVYLHSSADQKSLQDTLADRLQNDCDDLVRALAAQGLVALHGLTDHPVQCSSAKIDKAARVRRALFKGMKLWLGCNSSASLPGEWFSMLLAGVRDRNSSVRVAAASCFAASAGACGESEWPLPLIKECLETNPGLAEAASEHLVHELVQANQRLKAPSLLHQLRPRKALAALKRSMCTPGNETFSDAAAFLARIGVGIANWCKEDMGHGCAVSAIHICPLALECLHYGSAYQLRQLTVTTLQVEMGAGSTDRAALAKLAAEILRRSSTMDAAETLLRCGAFPSALLGSAEESAPSIMMIAALLLRRVAAESCNSVRRVHVSGQLFKLPPVA
eukprot:958705-Amphidinium_carterae.1